MNHSASQMIKTDEERPAINNMSSKEFVSHWVNRDFKLSEEFEIDVIFLRKKRFQTIRKID